MYLLDDLMNILCGDDNEELKKFKKLNDQLVLQEIQK